MQGKPIEEAIVGGNLTAVVKTKSPERRIKDRCPPLPSVFLQVYASAMSEPLRFLSVLASEHFEALDVALKGGVECAVDILVLGPPSSRAAYVPRSPLLLHGDTLAALLFSLPRDLVVRCRDVRWSFNTFDRWASAENALFSITPFEPRDRSDMRGQSSSFASSGADHREMVLAVPSGTILDDNAWAHAKAQSSSDVRLVRIVRETFANGQGGGNEKVTPVGVLAAHQELIINICDSHELSWIGDRMLELGRGVKNLSIRCGDLTHILGLVREYSEMQTR